MTHTIGWYGTNRGLHAFSGQLDCCRCHLQCRWALPTATAATAVQNRMRPHNDKPISKVTGIASLGLGESPLLGCCETVLCSHILRKEIHHMHSTNMHPPPPPLLLQQKVYTCHRHAISRVRDNTTPHVRTFAGRNLKRAAKAGNSRW